MAGRNYKKGLDYFYLSVDFGSEDAIELIDGEFGARGFRAITKLLQRIYKKEGYYIEWNEKRKILFANAINEQVSLVDDIITRSFKWGLFDQTVFTQLGILTSADIQFNYLNAVKRRDKVEIIKEYSLCNICAFENVICVNINEKSGNEISHSKVENSKVENSKEKDIVAPAAPTDTKIDFENKNLKKREIKFVPPSIQKVESYFLKKMGDTSLANAWPEDRCKNKAAEFFDHYTANGWVQGRGKPIKDWEAACRNWMRNEIKGVFSKPEAKAHNKSDETPQLKPVSVEPLIPHLPKPSVEINYLYGRFLEDQVTIISIDVSHYDYLRKTNMIEWTPDQAAEIRKKTKDHILEKQLPADDRNELKFMKLFGVIEYFKILKHQGKETVFDEAKK